MDYPNPYRLWMISIHAPARGATRQYRKMVRPLQFQSTLPQGERRTDGIRGRAEGDFNPRSRKGSDPSTEARAITRQHFNPRSRKGSDYSTTKSGFHYHKFQSTLPQGERLSWSLNVPELEYFNPRSRKGSDCGSCKNPLDGDISIHAPARGATVSAC